LSCLCSLFGPESNPGSHIASVAITPQSLPIYSSSSVLSSMTLALLNWLVCFVSGISFNHVMFSIDSIQVMHFWQEYYRSDACPSQLIRSRGTWCWYVLWWWFRKGDVFQISPCKVTIFSFVICKYLMGRHYETMQIFCFMSYFCPLISALIDESCLQRLYEGAFLFLSFLLYLLLEFSCKKKLFLFLHLLIYLYQYGLKDFVLICKSPVLWSCFGV